MKKRTVYDKLRLFYEIKNARVKRYSGINLYSKSDLDEVSNPYNTYLTQESYWKYLVDLTTNPKNHRRPDGLKNTTCIWCTAFRTNSFVIDNDCIRCTYGKRNGICEDGLWLDVVMEMDDPCELFPSDWYINLINNIEKEGNKGE